MYPDAELKNRVLETKLSLNHWYAVEKSSAIRKGHVKKVVIADESLVIYRQASDQLVALEDRCAHRHIPLSKFGKIENDLLVCSYHGWAYNAQGSCTSIPLIPGGVQGLKNKPCIKAYPIKEKYQLIWVFPGDSNLAESTPLPKIERLDQHRIPFTVIDETFEAHHSQVIENFCDLYHEKLHEKYQPFNGSELVEIQEHADGLSIEYDTNFSRGLVLKHFLKDFKANTRVRLNYRYPHLSLDFEGSQELWIFMLPISEKQTRILAFFLPQFVIPWTRLSMPFALAKLMTMIFTVIYSRTFTHEDVIVLKAETESLQKHRDKPYYEANPVMPILRRILVSRSPASLPR